MEKIGVVLVLSFESALYSLILLAKSYGYTLSASFDNALFSQYGINLNLDLSSPDRLCNALNAFKFGLRVWMNILVYFDIVRE